MPGGGEEEMLEGVEVADGGLLSLGDEAKTRLLAQTPLELVFDVQPAPFARGKFATVRRAFRKDDQSLYAAKYIRKRRRVSPQEVWHEVCILNLSRDSPFIVHLYQVFETALDTILMLEMAEGGDLQTVLDREDCLSEPLSRPILRDTLKGLHFLHLRSIAHLDIKPSNVVVTGPLPGGRVKLCDFGLSRHLSTTTEVRELFGTPEYVSPEVLSYEPLSVAVDCWSVGVLAYVLLSGLSPFGGETKQETFLNISTRALTFPPSHFASTSPSALRFIQALLNLQPTERLTSEEALEHEWLDMDLHMDLPPPLPPLPPPEPNNNKNASPPPHADAETGPSPETPPKVTLSRKPRISLKKPELKSRGASMTILKTP